MNTNLRLRLLKTFINIPLRILDHLIPRRQPTFPQTQLVAVMYGRMFQAYRLEQAQGVFKENGNFKGDGNFERLLSVSQKVLTLIGEDDRYYREWLGLFVLLAHEEYLNWQSTLTPEQIKYWCNLQWQSSPDCLTDGFIESRKEEFAPNVLAYYLHTLSTKPYSNKLNEQER
jgi:hypothetical protein